jgi:hypothetical protein
MKFVTVEVIFHMRKELSEAFIPKTKKEGIEKSPYEICDSGSNFPYEEGAEVNIMLRNVVGN